MPQVSYFHDLLWPQHRISRFRQRLNHPLPSHIYSSYEAISCEHTGRQTSLIMLIASLGMLWIEATAWCQKQTLLSPVPWSQSKCHHCCSLKRKKNTTGSSSHGNGRIQSHIQGIKPKRARGQGSLKKWGIRAGMYICCQIHPFPSPDMLPASPWKALLFPSLPTPAPSVLPLMVAGCSGSRYMWPPAICTGGCILCVDAVSAVLKERAFR